MSAPPAYKCICHDRGLVLVEPVDHLDQRGDGLQLAAPDRFADDTQGGHQAFELQVSAVDEYRPLSSVLDPSGARCAECAISMWPLEAATIVTPPAKRACVNIWTSFPPLGSGWGLAMALTQGAVAQQNPVTAIDIAIEPDATMI